MWPDAPPSTRGYQPTAIELHLFVPTTDGAFSSMLQEDDGLTFAAQDGARYRTSFEVGRSGGTIVLRAKVEGDGFAEFARDRFVLVLHGAAPDTIQVDGSEVSGTDGRFEFFNRGAGFVAAFAA